MSIRRGGLKPAGDHHLGIGKEVENLAPMPFHIPKDGIPCSAKGEETHGRGDADVNPHHTGLHPVLEFLRAAPLPVQRPAALANPRVLISWMAWSRFLAWTKQANHRPKDLLPGNGHGGVYLMENGRPDIGISNARLLQKFFPPCFPSQVGG